MIAFTDDHPDVRFTWFSSAHDEETDKWKPTSIVHKIAVVDRAVQLGYFAEWLRQCQRKCF